MIVTKEKFHPATPEDCAKAVEMVVNDATAEDRVRIYPAIELCDAWLEPSDGKCRLIVATKAPGQTKEFWVRLSAGAFVKFEHVADLKNQRLFEATRIGSEHGEGPVEPSPLLQLLGPLQRAYRELI